MRGLRLPLFWVITQTVVAFPYRRFGTTYRSRNVGKEFPIVPKRQ